MIVATTSKPSFSAFEELLRRTDEILNEDAKVREACGDNYYLTRKGSLLENDVFEALEKAAAGTEFEGTIKLVSGKYFPDIVAAKYYGIEVKSTDKNQWTTIGGSIRESTRVEDVERIFITFGKLKKPVQFLSRPYEDCIDEIAATHYPRYQIDMRLKAGETIFDKMGISYDDLRQMDNPLVPVSKYYKSKLKPGQSLWWAADGEETAVPVKVSLWTALTTDERENIIAQGYALFPEILGVPNNKKYNRYALWLATGKGIVNTSIRDSFSAGGKVKIKLKSGKEISVPASIARIEKYKTLITDTILNESEESLKEYWQSEFIEKDRIAQWCKIVIEQVCGFMDKKQALEIFNSIF